MKCNIQEVNKHLCCETALTSGQLESQDVLRYFWFIECKVLLQSLILCIESIGFEFDKKPWKRFRNKIWRCLLLHTAIESLHFLQPSGSPNPPQARFGDGVDGPMTVYGRSMTVSWHSRPKSPWGGMLPEVFLLHILDMQNSCWCLL